MNSKLVTEANVAAHVFWHHNEYDLMFIEGNKSEASYIVYGDLMVLTTHAVEAGLIDVSETGEVEFDKAVETKLHEFVISQYNEVSENIRGTNEDV